MDNDKYLDPLTQAVIAQLKIAVAKEVKANTKDIDRVYFDQTAFDDFTLIINWYAQSKTDPYYNHTGTRYFSISEVFRLMAEGE